MDHLIRWRLRRQYRGKRPSWAILVIGLAWAYTVSACSSGQAPEPSTPTKAEGQEKEILIPASYGDGRKESKEAIQRALLDVASSGGGRVRLPRGRFLVSGGGLELSGRVTLEGSGTDTVLEYSSAAGYGALLEVSGSRNAIRHMTVTRITAGDGCAVVVHPGQSFSASGVTFDGRVASFRGDYHGICLAGQRGEQTRDILIEDSQFKDLDYGLLRSSEQPGETSLIVVRNSVFSGNHASDLEFNSPGSTMNNVVVIGNTFERNRSSTDAAGWGVGLAHVTQATISGNRFSDYGGNPIHIEDGTANVMISKNEFRRTSTRQTSWAAFVLILSGSHDVTVSDNVFDAREQNTALSCLYAGDGGSGVIPFSVRLSGNKCFGNGRTELIAVYNARDVKSDGTDELKQ